MNGLFKKLQLKRDSNTTAGTIGDLILTCNSTESRNFTFGKLLAAYSVDKSLGKINSTVEGYHSLSSIEYFKTLAKVELPLATFVSKIIQLNNPKKIKRYFENFVSLI